MNCNGIDYGKRGPIRPDEPRASERTMSSDASGQAQVQPVGRLAPSPTGGLHLGHARSFLIAWLAARTAGGRLILRIEDLDASRVRAEAVGGAIQDLRWLGLDWDEGPDIGGSAGPYVQSERLGLYLDALERLKDRKLVYPCTCTRSDIERAASAPHATEEGATYPGTCAWRSASDDEHLPDRPFAWRFRVPSSPVAWHDMFRAEMRLDPARSGGDFVVARSTGAVAYQLAVVVDDALMGVNQVVRGDDLMISTPRQILLYQALGWPAPAFGHVPLVYGADGRRLAKRDQSIKLAMLRQRGTDPRRLVAILARSFGWVSEDRPLDPRDLIGQYRPEFIPTEPWTVTGEVLERLLGGH